MKHITDLSTLPFPIDSSALELLPESVARENIILPLKEEGGMLTVITSTPDDFEMTEKLRFIYRDFPLRSNAHAPDAAKLAHCAGEQGEYWQMFDF